MGGNKRCSRDDCSPVNVQMEYTAKCGHCGNELHLPCIGIEHKVNEVLFHRNIRVFCNDCSESLPVGAHTMPKAHSVVKPSSLSSSAFFGATNSGAVSSAKMDAIAALLLEVRDIARDTNKKVTSNVDSSQSYADVAKKVDEIRDIATKTNERVNEKCFNKPVALPAGRSLIAFPPLGTPSSKRKCESSPPPLQSQRKFVGRKLTTGTATITTHGLGSRVELSNGNMLQSPRTRLAKAIYVSRMQNDVTKEKIVEYLKSQVADLNENEISLRLLVKKDVDVSTRRFISYRLACTEALYDKFIKPSFWPDHIEIGEFFEDSRERGSNNVASFASPSAINARRNARITRPLSASAEPVHELLHDAAAAASASKNGEPSVMEI